MKAIEQLGVVVEGSDQAPLIVGELGIVSEGQEPEVIANTLRHLLWDSGF